MKLPLTLATAALAFSSSVGAVPIVQTFDFNIGGVPLPHQSAPTTSQLSFFDASLGTLDSVAVDVHAAVTITGQAPQNLSPPFAIPIAYSVLARFDLGFDGPNTALSHLVNPFFQVFIGHPGGGSLPINGTFLIDQNFAYDEISDLTGQVFADSSGTGGGTFVEYVNTAPIVMGRRQDFVGVGPFVIESSLNSLIYSGPLAVSGGPVAITPSASGRLTLTYDYTPAPVVSVDEPGALGLLALGLIPLGFGRRGVSAARRRNRMRLSGTLSTNKN